MGKAQKVILQQTPEKERNNSFLEEPSLSLTSICSTRDEENNDETLDKTKYSDLDCEVKEVELFPIDDGYCHCGSFKGCQYMSTEERYEMSHNEPT